MKAFWTFHYKVSHHSLEIILACWFVAKEIFFIIIYVENSFCGNWLFDEWKVKKISIYL